MNRRVLFGLLTVTGLLTLVGCGSGSTPDPKASPSPSPSPTPTRSALEILLSGNSSTGSRRWRFIAMKPNDKYFPAPGHTSDQEPCGAAYFQIDPDDKFLHTRVCSTSLDMVEFRADGKSRVRFVESTDPFNESWSLGDSPNGPTLSCPLIYIGKAGDPPITGNYVLTDDGPTGNTAVSRIRLKVLSEAQSGKPGLVRTAGFEYVLESFGGTP
jgi:hypothetical protein